VLPFALPAHPTPLRVLCLGAHADDIEIGCGGTVLRLLAEHPNTAVYWAVFSGNGEREREARASAADFLREAGDTTVVVKSFRDSYFPAQASLIKDYFEELKLEVNPNLIFCHHRHDVHQDHRMLAELVWNSFRDHLVLEYEIPKYEGDLGTPNLFVPLSRKVAEQKVELVVRHFGSQRTRDWFSSDLFHGLMSVRGVECRAPELRAEAFHLRKGIL
jgi:LmbE family N-acetylglucosaminyl deacetylase